MTTLAKASDRSFHSQSKERDVRSANITAARLVADAIRTILGPFGMDKMIVQSGGDVTTTNDGATIMAKMELQHPIAKMLVDVSRAQDTEAGDGTTTVVVLAGALLSVCQTLLTLGMHPTTIATALGLVKRHAWAVLLELSLPVDFDDRSALLQLAATSLSSKVVSGESDHLSSIVVDAAIGVLGPADAETTVRGRELDLSQIQMVKKLGGSVCNTTILDGLILWDRPTEASAKRIAGPARVDSAHIGLIQFQLSPPKPDIAGEVVVTQADHIDRVLREEKRYIAQAVRAIKRTGCNVLLIQKSILKDAVTDTAISLLNRAKILTVTNVERKDIEFIATTLGCTPVASAEAFTAACLGTAALVEDKALEGAGRIVRITRGGKGSGPRTRSVLVRASNKLLLDETERSLHDALCVMRSLARVPRLLVGGGAPEIALAVRLETYAATLSGALSVCVRRLAEAFEVVPSTLAENAGMDSVGVLTALRAKHVAGESTAGVDLSARCVADLAGKHIVQPLLVTRSAVTLAAEFCQSVLKIDDILYAH